MIETDSKSEACFLFIQIAQILLQMEQIKENSYKSDNKNALASTEPYMHGWHERNYLIRLNAGRRKMNSNIHELR